MSLARVRRIHARTRRFMTVSILLASAVLTLGSTTAPAAIPVIPGGAGFGMETLAGRGGKVYRVTNLKADGAGSLKACVDGKEPRICIFEVSGTIRITSDLMIRHGRLTIAGQTAPSPGIMIRGAALRIQASDILVQHIRVRAGDDTNGPDPDNRESRRAGATRPSRPLRSRSLSSPPT